MNALGDEIHSPIRLVVVPGLHLKDWSKENKPSNIAGNSPITEQGATAEIEDIWLFPGR